ncbi:MAG TPA: hypothetical protein PLQ23_09480 [Dermatophilaceae bacterium]|nr:hypothetical protein [Dermatophilaceae bacterium]
MSDSTMKPSTTAASERPGTTAVYRKYLKLGIALIAVGAIVHAIFVALRGVGEPGNPFWTLLDPALTIIRWSFMPLGSALIGAAIVIKELGPSSTEQRVER